MLPFVARMIPCGPSLVTGKKAVLTSFPLSALIARYFSFLMVLSDGLPLSLQLLPAHF
jgi:hypothetical protein